MTANTDPAFFSGLRWAAATRGVTPDALIKMAGRVDALHSAAGEPFGRFCAALGCHILSEANVPLSVPLRAGYEVLNKSASWSREHQSAAVTPVLAALGDVALVKQAGPSGSFMDILGEGLAKVLPKGTAMAPKMFMTLLGLSALGGAGAGLATWHGERDVSEDDIATDATQTQANYYALLAKRMQQRAQQA